MRSGYTEFDPGTIFGLSSSCDQARIEQCMRSALESTLLPQIVQGDSSLALALHIRNVIRSGLMTERLKGQVRFGEMIRYAYMYGVRFDVIWGR